MLFDIIFFIKVQDSPSWWGDEWLKWRGRKQQQWEWWKWLLQLKQQCIIWLPVKQWWFIISEVRVEGRQ